MPPNFVWLRCVEHPFSPGLAAREQLYRRDFNVHAIESLGEPLGKEECPAFPGVVHMRMMSGEVHWVLPQDVAVLEFAIKP